MKTMRATMLTLTLALATSAPAFAVDTARTYSSGLLIGVFGALLPWRGGSVQPDWRLAQQAPAPVAQPEAASVAPVASAVQMAQAPAEPVPAAAASSICRGLATRRNSLFCNR